VLVGRWRVGVGVDFVLVLVLAWFEMMVVTSFVGGCEVLIVEY
jgi:hypothetical protein